MAAILLVMALTALVLAGGAYVLWRRGGSTRQIVLMLVLVLVMAFNVAIWILPDASGTAPLGRELR